MLFYYYFFILQEVDHYNYFQKTLSTQGFKGIFFPKPDSPCIYIKDNNGPDGCAIFYREDKYELVLSANRILEVWRVQSNQVINILKLFCHLLCSKQYISRKYL